VTNGAGELDWVRQMIDKFDATARGTGAKIVSCCGHDSVIESGPLGAVHLSRHKWLEGLIN